MKVEKKISLVLIYKILKRDIGSYLIMWNTITFVKRSSLELVH